MKVLCRILALTALLAPGMVQGAQITHEADGDFDWYFVIGDLELADGEIFQRQVQTTLRPGKTGAVVLNSAGGSVVASYTMVKTIVDHGLATLVPKTANCYSACFAIFMAGSERLAHPGSNLGVHRISVDSQDDVHAKGFSVDMGELYRALNVPPAIRLAMLETPPSEMYVLSQEEKRQISTMDTSRLSAQEVGKPSGSGSREKQCADFADCIAVLFQVASSEDYRMVTETLSQTVVPGILRFTRDRYDQEQLSLLEDMGRAIGRQTAIADSILASAGITDEYSVYRVRSALLLNVALELAQMDPGFAQATEKTQTSNPPVFARFSDIHNLAFADRYNELRELCQAGFCNEEMVKDQERSWIERNKIMLRMHQNSPYGKMVGEFMIDRQIQFINTLKYVISSRIKGRTYASRFDFSSHRSLMGSVSELFSRFDSLTETEIRQYNAALGAYVIPYLEYELKSAGYDDSEFNDLSLTGGAYDLVYREFFVSSSRMFYGSGYNRAATEQVKLEGKIMRVANMLILLLRDSELDGATYFRCHSRRCTRQEAEAMYRGFEENVKDLSRLCSRKKKCNAKQLERMRGVYVQYDKLIGRLASRHHVPSVDHVMAMVRIWAAGRMRRDLATFSK